VCIVRRSWVSLCRTNIAIKSFNPEIWPPKHIIVKSLNRVQYSIDIAGYLKSIIVEVSVILVMLSLTLFSSVPQP
jgi:hypothetical protein